MVALPACVSLTNAFGFSTFLTSWPDSAPISPAQSKRISRASKYVRFFPRIDCNLPILESLHRCKRIESNEVVAEAGKSRNFTDQSRQGTLYLRGSLSEVPKERLKNSVVLLCCRPHFPGECPVWEEGWGESLRWLLAAQSRVIVAPHWQGTGVSSDENQLALLSESIEVAVGCTVVRAAGPVSPVLGAQLATMPPGSVLLLSNRHNAKEETVNDKKVAAMFGGMIDMVVNDTLSTTHRVRLSTVGVAPYVAVRVAGLWLQHQMDLLHRLLERPGVNFTAIVGAGTTRGVLPILQTLLRHCRRLILTGPLLRALLPELNLPCSASSSINGRGTQEVAAIVTEIKRSRVPLLLPTHWMCCPAGQMQGSDTVCATGAIPTGWEVMEIAGCGFDQLGPHLDSSQMLLWLGPTALHTGQTPSERQLRTRLAEVVAASARSSGCQTIAVGRQLAEAIAGAGLEGRVSILESSSATFEALRGRVLPGVAALDPGQELLLEWSVIFKDPMLPLVVDVGCGNGIFILRLACQYRSKRNFLGMEVLPKLVEGAAAAAADLRLPNTYFVRCNATAILQSLLCTYPGPISLMAIQCPDPDFGASQKRWRLVQQPLLDAAAELLAPGGQMFLQSDVREVAERMQNQLSSNPALSLSPLHAQHESRVHSPWLDENPFDAPTDWETHAIAAGRHIFRALYVKRI